MSSFADSSALVKLYADEPGSDLARGLRGLVISVVARVEVPAAVWAKVRSTDLEAADGAALVSDFEVDFFGSPSRPQRFSPVGASVAILGDAARLARTHGLRAYDAVQLASALAARAADPSCVAFACFDDDLRAAAAAGGFELVP